MVAVPEGFLSAPDVVRTAPAPPARERRFVAVAVDATELLRPESDLVRLVDGAAYVDVLLATELAPVASAPLGVLGSGSVWTDPADVHDPADPYDDGDDDPDHPPPVDIAGLDAAGLDVPELHVHRLGLSGTLGPAAADDLVAALSELVGFDPDPGVYLLGPAGSGPGRVAVQQAVQRVAQVYGIPLLRYRCLELSVVEPD